VQNREKGMRVLQEKVIALGVSHLWDGELTNDVLWNRLRRR